MAVWQGITKSTDPSPEQILCQILLVDLLVVTLVGHQSCQWPVTIFGADRVQAPSDMPYLAATCWVHRWAAISRAPGQGPARPPWSTMTAFCMAVGLGGLSTGRVEYQQKVPR